MSKYGRYICTTLEKRYRLPGPTPEQRDRLAGEGKRIGMEHMHWIDEDVIPGAYYGETTWIWPSDYPNQVSWKDLAEDGFVLPDMFPHAHDFPELLSWWGTDPEDSANTDPMALQLDDEIIPITSSFVAYIPANMPHMPIFPTGDLTVTRPTLHWVTGPGGVYTRDEDESATTSVPNARKIDYSASKHARYIVQGTPADVKRPDFLRPLNAAYSRPMAYIDRTVVPDAEFGCDTRWLLPGDASKAGQFIMDAHAVPHGTSIACVPLNYANITDLCAEVELWIGGEKHIIKEAFWAYVPPNVSQGPMIVRNVTKQIFLMMSWPLGEGIEKYPGGR